MTQVPSFGNRFEQFCYWADKFMAEEETEWSRLISSRPLIARLEVMKAFVNFLSNTAVADMVAKHDDDGLRGQLSFYVKAENGVIPAMTDDKWRKLSFLCRLCSANK
jgi:hypothetical protein